LQETDITDDTLLKLVPCFNMAAHWNEEIRNNL